MPMIIKRIDEIARQRHSDVVFLEFFSIRDRRMTSKPVSSLFHLFEPVDWERHPSRKRILSWLTQNDIHWIPCYGPESDGFIVSPYQGQVFIDVPYAAELPEQAQDPLFQCLCNFIETDEGRVRWAGVRFCGLALSVAELVHKRHQKRINPNLV